MTDSISQRDGKDFAMECPRCQCCGRQVVTSNFVNGRPLCFDCKFMGGPYIKKIK